MLWDDFPFCLCEWDSAFAGHWAVDHGVLVFLPQPAMVLVFELDRGVAHFLHSLVGFLAAMSALLLAGRQDGVQVIKMPLFQLISHRRLMFLCCSPPSDDAEDQNDGEQKQQGSKHHTNYQRQFPVTSWKTKSRWDELQEHRALNERTPRHRFQSVCSFIWLPPGLADNDIFRFILRLRWKTRRASTPCVVTG